MAVLCAMRRGVTTLFAPCGGHNGRPVRHAGWQRGRETPPALRATSPARRRSSYHAAKVSEPGTPSFKRLEHPVSRPETLRALGAPTFSSKKGFPVAKEALITTIPKGLFHHLHHLVALLHDINAFLQAFKTIANLHSA